MEEFSRLCCLVVEDIYGGFLAQIFQHLTQQGRLSANQLAQRCRLPLRQVKAGIAALIQLRLVYHHTTPDGLSTYQADTNSAYNLIRAGRIVQLVERRYGQVAAKIIENLAILGYATADELEVQMSGVDQLAATEELATSANGQREDGILPGDSSHTRAGFRIALRHLIDNRYITCVRDSHFQSRFDARQEVERHLQRLGVLPSAKGKKMQLDVDQRVDAELQLRLDGTISSASILHDLDKRDFDDEHMTYNQSKHMLCIDYSNFIISVRNENVASIAQKLLGDPAAQVARAACLQVDVDSGPFKVRDAVSAPIQRLDISQLCTDLADQAAQDRQSGDGVGSDWPREEHAVNGHTGLHDPGKMHPQQIGYHLAALAEGPFSFISQDHHGGHWLIHRAKLTEFLRDTQLTRLMGESLGGPALRIVRMLMDKGKLDEKSLQEIGLLGAKELRQCLAQLQMMGFLELQEVPREPQRQPNRTIFLWFYDPERVRKVFLGRLYKTMARLFQRLHLEREKLASTLSKVERTDVQGSEEEMLSPAELQVLRQWRQREAWFMAEISRLDDSVIILRDI